MWIVSQIGAREHYGIARALQSSGRLTGMITDFWVPPGSVLGFMPGGARLRDRFHHELEGATVTAPNLRMLGYEMQARLRKLNGWDRIMARNQLFQHEALKALRDINSRRVGSEVPTVFSYSYAARDLFRVAKGWGWNTVLGQIDPGPGEDAIVRRLRAAHPEWAGPNEASPPESYWRDWREECALADRIVVNSEWSRSLIADAGIEQKKIEVLPLAYDPGEPTIIMDGRFSPSELKLRVLYLGQVIVRKGIQDLVAAARMLTNESIQIDIVGPHGPLPQGLPENLTFHGAVPRSEAAKWYARADVFVLPTHSDGFALTQLEAMSYGLPVIATACCGEVVNHGENGLQVAPGDAESLAERLRWMLEHPQERRQMRVAARKTAESFGLNKISKILL